MATKEINGELFACVGCQVGDLVRDGMFQFHIQVAQSSPLISLVATVSKGTVKHKKSCITSVSSSRE